MKRVYKFILGLFLIGMVGCQPSEEKSPIYVTTKPLIHDVNTENKPWTDENFDTEQFTFAIFSDLTGGERPGVFSVAVEQLNLLRPELIINVGDLVEGDVDSIAELHAQWDHFDKRAKKAKAPVFYVGGNHDLTGEDMWQVWEERYGMRYYHFIYKNVLFLILDSEDHTPEGMEKLARIRKEAMIRIEEEGPQVYKETEYANLPEQFGGNIGTEQAKYFTEVISTNSQVWHTFLFVHKAPWQKNDTNFAKIETALKERPYTVFHGHKHTYSYAERNGRDYIQLGTTGGAQYEQDGINMDHVTLVTVDSANVNIANLKLDGILNKQGVIPLNGDTLF